MTADVTPRVVDAQEFIGSRPLSHLQKLLLVLCFLIVAIDGFDTALSALIDTLRLSA